MKDRNCSRQSVLRPSSFGGMSFIVALLISARLLLLVYAAHVTRVPLVLANLELLPCLLGISLAIAGLSQKDRTRLLPVLGLILNGALFLGIAVWSTVPVWA